ncbi:MAG: LamG domain-containing protein [Planctomycetes bacterium]|nr:LamG domain-containing protein [Planctomycetota bacterium]
MPAGRIAGALRTPAAGPSAPAETAPSAPAESPQSSSADASTPAEEPRREYRYIFNEQELRSVAEARGLVFMEVWRQGVTPCARLANYVRVTIQDEKYSSVRFWIVEWDLYRRTFFDDSGAPLDFAKSNALYPVRNFPASIVFINGRPLFFSGTTLLEDDGSRKLVLQAKLGADTVLKDLKVPLPPDFDVSEYGSICGVMDGAQLRILWDSLLPLVDLKTVAPASPQPERPAPAATEKPAVVPAAGNSATAAVEANIQKNMVAHWSFERWLDHAGHLAEEDSVQRIPAHILQPPCSFVPGISGNTLRFDGKDDYVRIGSGDVPRSLQLSNEITLEAWIFVTEYPHSYTLGMIVGSQYDPTGSGASIFFDGRTNPDGQTACRGHIHFQIGNGTFHVTNSNSRVPLNQWVHIVAARKAGEKGRIYYNGVLQPSTSAPWNGSITYKDSEMAVGRQKDYTDRYFKGIIDEVSIYNRALTSDEVQSRFSRMREHLARAAAEVQAAAAQEKEPESPFLLDEKAKQEEEFETMEIVDEILWEQSNK